MSDQPDKVEKVSYEWIDELPAAQVVAVDTETSGLFPDDAAEVSCVSVAWRDKSGELRSEALPFDQGIRAGKHSVGMTAGQRKSLAAWVEADQPDDGFGWPNWQGVGRELWERLLLALCKSSLVMHNAQFDTRIIWRGAPFGWRTGNLMNRVHWDTMLCADLIEPLDRVGLDACAKRLGLSGKAGIEEVWEWLRKAKLPKHRYDLAPWELVEKYVTGDAELTLLVQEDQYRYFQEGRDLPVVKWEWRDFQKQMKLMRALLKITDRGVGYDSERSLAEAERLEVRVNELAAVLPFNTLPKAKKWWAAEGYLESAGESTPEHVLVEMIERRVPWAEEWRQIQKDKRTVSMYYRGYPDKIGPDGRLRCVYRQTGVRSGRLSVERVNLQALPKSDKLDVDSVGVRKLLQPREGYSLWALDMSQAELRVATQYAGCETMKQMLLEGVDFHSVTTETVLGVPRDAPDFKLRRDIGKRLTFASIFQIGPQSFQTQLYEKGGIRMALSEAERIVKAWRRAYPEFGVAYRRWERVAEAESAVPQLIDTPWETVSYFDLTGHRDGRVEWSHTAWSRVVQGSLAQWLRLWLIGLEERWPGAVVMTVHDSVYLEIEGGKAETEKVVAEVATWSATEGESLFKIPMPIDCDWYGSK